jgi:chromosome segregation ATPase
MTEEAFQRARERLREAAEGRSGTAAVDAALERARAQVEELAQTTAELESTIPVKVEHAVADGLREQVRPVGRNLAEIRGLMNQVIRRLERVEGDLLSERHARVDDLALLVELITSSWKSVERRLSALERKLEAGDSGVVYRMGQRRAG